MNNLDKIRRVMEQNRSGLAFVIGNGINRYAGDETHLSWHNLLGELWESVQKDPVDAPDNLIPEGISTTEFYDILSLQRGEDSALQKKVCDLLDDWKPREQHRQILGLLERWEVPVLTTNFDNTFARSGEYAMRKLQADGFSDFYPWSVYYSNRDLASPGEGFGIWHINGMLHYHRSIRLGLSHFMGSVQRAQRMMRGSTGLFAARAGDPWKGAHTWLEILIRRPLIIFGLGLEENEIFLRWLLIQRIRYYRKKQAALPPCWYLDVPNLSPRGVGKKLFLHQVGIEVVDMGSYEEIYRGMWEE